MVTPAMTEVLLEPAAPSATHPVGGAPRRPEAAVDPAFVERWSSRAFSSEPVTLETVRSLFEAARFAPSAGNSQPWLFVYAAERATRRRVLPILKEDNRRWAEHAPLLVFVFARRHDPKTGLPLRSYAFDTGAAWFSLALQAQRLGLNCRAMGGLHHDQAYRLLGVPEQRFESMVGIAIGYPGSRDDLPPELADKDVPSGRERQPSFVYNGRYYEPET